jgi:rRNA-processing protein FCF1
MCLIVDTNLINIVLKKHPNVIFGCITKALFDTKSRVTMVYGGKCYLNELEKCNCLKIAKSLTQAGKAKKIKDTEVDEEEQRVASMQIQSDDPHILALARLSGIRLLCTEDKELMIDFKNTNIIPAPNGSIYSRRGHGHLLKQECMK